MTYHLSDKTIFRIVTMRRNRFTWSVISRRTGLPVPICRKAYGQWQSAAAKAEREKQEASP